MHFVLPYFIIIILVFQFFLRKNSKKEQQREREFWNRELKANTIRKQDISNLNYITIPDTLPAPDTTDELILNKLATFNSFRDKKLLNLTGISNTDLKLSYGVANLSILSEYDDNYASMVKSIIPLADALIQSSFTAEASEYLSFGIQTGSDISSNYTMLADYYLSCEALDSNAKLSKLNWLIEQADELNSMSSKTIVLKLQAYKELI